MTHFAFTNLAGVIGFGHRVPTNVLVIADDPNHEHLYDAIESVARRDQDGETLLVPGLPEAESGDQALDALIRFRRLVMQRLAEEVSF